MLYFVFYNCYQILSQYIIIILFMTQRHSWTQQEDQRIILLVQKYGAKNWTIIAIEINKTLEKKNHRSAKQCRQRWHNHLDKQINKNCWTKKQQKILFECHKKYGNKWTQIAKFLEGRTDNSIKNHFYSTLRKGLRRINKLIGSKKSTIEMGTIKPSVLSKILSYAEKDPNTLQNELEKKMVYNCQDLSELLLQFSNVKQNKEDKNRKNLNEEERKKLEKTIHEILSYNTNYQKEKAEKIRFKKNLYYREQQDSSQEQQQQQNSIQIQQQQARIQKYKQKIGPQTRKLRERIKKDSIELNQQKLKQQQKPKQSGDIKQSDQLPKTQKEPQTILQLKKFESQIHKDNDILVQIQDNMFYDKKSKEDVYDFPEQFCEIQQFQIPTPRLQNLQSFSPKPPTPTNFLKINESKYWTNITQEQLDSRFNETKTSIYSNNKNIIQQKQQNYNRSAMKSFISPRSAFKLY